MPSFDFSYEYDRAGNRTKKIDNLTSEVTTYTYDSANQLISMEEPGGTTTFEWDAAGNMIAKHAPDGTTTFTWDYEDQLTQVAPPVGDPVNFTYNAMGQRIQKDNTRFIYDGVQLLQETDLSNQTLRTNTFTNEGYGDLVSEHDGTDSSFPTFDGQWSTDAIVDDTAAVTDRFGYTAFGGEDSHTGSSTTPFRFVGRQSYYRDAETGLYLLGAGGNPYGAGRYYDPSLGRFISRDPIGLAGGDVNLYRYAGNNPVNGIDPSGTEWIKCSETKYMATSDYDSLRCLAYEITGDPKDWVCIWPVGNKSDWNHYPYAKQCAVADVSSLLVPSPQATTYAALVIQSLTGTDKGHPETLAGGPRDAVAMYQAAFAKFYGGSIPVRHPLLIPDDIIKTSGEGATPISILFVGGHSSTGFGGIIGTWPTVDGSLAWFTPNYSPKRIEKEGTIA